MHRAETTAVHNAALAAGITRLLTRAGLLAATGVLALTFACGGDEETITAAQFCETGAAQFGGMRDQFNKIASDLRAANAINIYQIAREVEPEVDRLHDLARSARDVSTNIEGPPSEPDKYDENIELYEDMASNMAHSANLMSSYMSSSVSDSEASDLDDFSRHSRNFIAELEAADLYVQLVCLGAQEDAAENPGPAVSRDAAIATEPVPEIVKFSDKHEQWRLVGIPATDSQRSGLKYAGSRIVEQPNHQSYRCWYSLDMPGTPSVVAYIWEPLEHFRVTPEGLEEVRTITLVKGNQIDVTWHKLDGQSHVVVLKGRGAVDLVRAVEEHGAVSFDLTFPDNPELSSKFDVANLVDALEINDLDCFLDR